MQGPGFSRHYLPLIAWLAFISFASSDSFSPETLLAFIGPLYSGCFRTRVRKRLAVVHFLTRKLAHFTEYAILGFWQRALS